MSGNNITFCINCGEKTEYIVKSQRVDMSVRGIEFSYVEHTAYCSVCGEEVYVPEINDLNVASREEAYRKAAKLITIPEINQLMRKYNIGAGPLAKVMGFGEVTINRYIGGQLPSKEHSAQLLEVLSSHKAMEKRLEANKHIITPIAYAKCREAINQLNVLYGQKKIELVARYILNKAVEITPLALQKLLYFSQAFFNALYHEPLFLDDCQAWAHGPVYPDIYYQYKEFGYNPIEKALPEDDSDFTELTTKELNFLDAIVDIFGMYSGQTLSRITHSERPWIEARGSLFPSDRSVTVISRDSIDSYFIRIVEKYQIINPCDITLYCSDMIANLS